MNVGLVGNSDVGKTSLIRKFVKGDTIDDTSKISTVGVDRNSIKVKINDEPVEVILWDPAG